MVLADDCTSCADFALVLTIPSAAGAEAGEILGRGLVYPNSAATGVAFEAGPSAHHHILSRAAGPAAEATSHPETELADVEEGAVVD